EELQTSSSFWNSLDTREIKIANHFDLNKLAYIHDHSIPFPKYKHPLADETLRFADSWLVTTKFKLPKWMYNKIHQRAIQNHKK
ncbi:hypothetical protein Q6286_25745, partial [Klebsiella pneumoniae]|nr:hypothetical protein [Klebsiella pneumoniae]